MSEQDKEIVLTKARDLGELLKETPKFQQFQGDLKARV